MIAALIRLIAGAQARWVGVDPIPPDGMAKPRIYFANHASHLDAPLIWASLPKPLRLRTHPVAARDFWDAGPLRRTVVQRFGAVLIDRAGQRPHQDILLQLQTLLDAGQSLILFPEGTRTTDPEGEMNEFKSGLWHLARRCPQAELVPVYLENLNRILPKGDFLWIPLLSSVTFGPPICLGDHEGRATFMRKAAQAVAALGASDRRRNDEA